MLRGLIRFHPLPATSRYYALFGIAAHYRQTKKVERVLRATATDTLQNKLFNTLTVPGNIIVYVPGVL